jgi:hypothetical protein
MSGQEITGKTSFHDSQAKAVPGMILMVHQSNHAKDIFHWMRSKSVKCDVIVLFDHSTNENNRIELSHQVSTFDKEHRSLFVNTKHLQLRQKATRGRNPHRGPIRKCPKDYAQEIKSTLAD